MIAFVDKALYQELYAISKMQLAQKNYAKWNNYEIKVEEALLNSIRQFVPIDGEKKSNSKSYRLTKNRIPTGVFSQKREQNLNNNIGQQQNSEINEEDL